MIRVLFTWYESNAGGKQSVHWTLMRQVPTEGQTVHVPLSADPDDSRAMTVRHVAWATDQPPVAGHAWHAEVALS